MQLFKDIDVDTDYKKLGYCKLTLMDPSEYDELIEQTNALLKGLPSKYKKGFHVLGLAEEPAIRLASNAIIAKYLKPGLLKLFVDDLVEMVPGIHVIKQPGIRGNLGLHQDSSHLNESMFLYATAWIPLQDVTTRNGCLRMVPGSHLFGNRQRGLTIADPLAKQRPILKKHMLPLPVKKGEVILFHSALFHGSSFNLSLKPRIAVMGMIKPKASPFLHYFKDNKTPEGKVDVFEVQPDFFYKNDVFKRPEKDALFLGSEDIGFTPIDANYLNEMYKLALEKYK